ncbi:lipopolysaccharide heptosyltransferase II [candidate division KSB1 bacterium]|nr:lipopolysaccharide heptosyltransferase II [candidate division KSB1 bacterium]
MKKHPDKPSLSHRGLNPPGKILIIRLSSIGDILLTTPVLRLLKQTFPSAELDFLIKSQFAPVLFNNPHVDHFFPFDGKAGRRELFRIAGLLKQRRYDLVVDLHANFRSFFWRKKAHAAQVVVFRKNRWRRFLLVKCGIDLFSTIRPVYQRYIDTLSMYDIHDDGHGPEYFLDTQSDPNTLLKKYDVKSGRILVCLCPGAGFFTKRWPVDNFVQVAKRLAEEKKATILVIGGERERNLGKILKQAVGPICIDMTGQTTFPQTAGLITRADLVISNDSGLMHLANSLKKKTLAIFGSTTEHFGFFPLPPFSRVLEVKNLKCRPCSHIGRKRCPRGHFRCMMEITPDMVFQAAEQMLGDESV